MLVSKQGICLLHPLEPEDVNHFILTWFGLFVCNVFQESHVSIEPVTALVKMVLHASIALFVPVAPVAVIVGLHYILVSLQRKEKQPYCNMWRMLLKWVIVV